MTKRIVSGSMLFLGALVALMAPAREAEAQCGHGSWFCAEVHVGGSVHVGPPVRQAQVVYVEPAPPPPPVVYVQPAPPPPPVVYVQPAPPPQPEVVYVQQQPQPTVHYEVVAPEPSGFGLHGHIGWMTTDRIAIGGLHGALRLRPNDAHLAIDLGLGAYGGVDYNGMDRIEVPLTADALFFMNPGHRFQLYGLAGLGASVAHTEGFNESTREFDMRDYTYVGGELGIGLEWRLTRWFALNGDIRGFVRTRVDSDPRPEFVDEETGQTTNTSGGVTGNLGATLYF